MESELLCGLTVDWGQCMGNVGRAMDLLADQGIRLTVVDVGASLEPFAAFRPLLGRATYVGFDPDLRELHHSSDGSGRRVVVNKAVVADPGQGTARFFLTHNPTCSSTLRPRAEAVDAYLHGYRFEVVDEIEAPATTLDEAMASIDVDRIDWLKLDTQGTDTRLLQSLGPELWSGLMAVDAEPGFDQHYEGEDTFVDLHREMTGRGFWLADLVLENAVRLRRPVFEESFRARSKITRMRYEFTLKTSPTAAGPRYLRTIRSLADAGAKRDDYLRLWACSLASGNLPYALDVIAATETAHGLSPETTALRQLTVRANKAAAWRNSWRLAAKLGKVRRLVSKPY